MSHFIETIANDNRNRLLRAAVEVFMEEGYGASMDRIASRAGMARQTLYNHFACKNDLFSEVAHMTASAILVSLEGDAKHPRTSAALWHDSAAEVTLYRRIGHVSHPFRRSAPLPGLGPGGS